MKKTNKTFPYIALEKKKEKKGLNQPETRLESSVSQHGHFFLVSLTMAIYTKIHEWVFKIRVGKKKPISKNHQIDFITSKLPKQNREIEEKMRASSDVPN